MQVCGEDIGPSHHSFTKRIGIPSYRHYFITLEGLCKFESAHSAGQSCFEYLGPWSRVQKYKLALHKQQDVLLSLGHLQNGSRTKIRVLEHVMRGVREKMCPLK